MNTLAEIIYTLIFLAGMSIVAILITIALCKIIGEFKGE